MYRVMIVDDEPIIRLGVKACIRWEALNVVLAGEYSNGREALAAIERDPVDILVTDIKMPLMDGLELTKQAIERHPGIKVILVSSYNEFEYARQGIVLGAVDYILKATMEGDEMNAVLVRCIEALDKETRIARKLDQSRQNEIEKKRKRLGHALMLVLCGETEESELAAMLPPSYRNGYLLVLAKVNRLGELLQRYGEHYLGVLEDDVHEQFYGLEAEGIAFPSGEGEAVFLMPWAPNALPALTVLKTVIEKKAACSLTFGCTEETEPGRFAASYERVRYAYEQSFFEGTGGIYRSAEAGLPAEAPGLSNAAGEVLAREQAAVRAELASVMHDPALLRACVSRWADRYERYERGGCRPLAIKKEAHALLAGALASQAGADAGVLPEYYRQFELAETLEELRQLLTSALLDTGRHPAPGDRTAAGHLVADKALHYISERFTEELTLQEVADHVHMSKNYFSMLFKKYTHHNFIDHLIQMRLQHAKELLMQPALKIYEVADRSGFNDVKYFSKLFKKMNGMTPAEFRDQRVTGNAGRGDAACADS